MKSLGRPCTGGIFYVWEEVRIFVTNGDSQLKKRHFSQSYVEECLFVFLSLFCDLWGWGVVLFSDFMFWFCFLLK